MIESKMKLLLISKGLIPISPFAPYTFLKSPYTLPLTSCKIPLHLTFCKIPLHLLKCPYTLPLTPCKIPLHFSPYTFQSPPTRPAPCTLWNPPTLYPSHIRKSPYTLPLTSFKVPLHFIPYTFEIPLYCTPYTL